MSKEKTNYYKKIMEEAEEANTPSSNTKETAKKELDSLFQNPIYENKGFDNFLQHEEFRLRKKDAESERLLREKNANRAFIFSALWTLCIAVIVFVKGFSPKFNLTEAEFIATIGTLSITILTYYMVVVRHLFNKGGSST